MNSIYKRDNEIASSSSRITDILHQIEAHKLICLIKKQHMSVGKWNWGRE
jgi:hypothetical protein